MEKRNFNETNAEQNFCDTETFGPHCSAFTAVWVELTD